MQRCALVASADGPRVVPTTQLQREHDNDLALENKSCSTKMLWKDLTSIRLFLPPLMYSNYLRAKAQVRDFFLSTFGKQSIYSSEVEWIDCWQAS